MFENICKKKFAAAPLFSTLLHANQLLFERVLVICMLSGFAVDAFKFKYNTGLNMHAYRCLDS